MYVNSDHFRVVRDILYGTVKRGSVSRSTIFVDWHRPRFHGNNFCELRRLAFTFFLIEDFEGGCYVKMTKNVQL